MALDTQNGILLFTAARTASHLFMRMMVSGQDPDRVVQAEYHFTDMLPHMSKLWMNNIASEICPVELRDEVWQTESKACVKTMEFFLNAKRKNLVAVAKEHVVFASRPEIRYSQHPLQLDPTSPGSPLMEPLSLNYDEIDAEIVRESQATWLTSPSTNVTVLPDPLLSSIVPVFLIRHPSLMMPSFVRIASTRNSDDMRRHLSVPSLLNTRLLFDWYCSQDKRFKEGSKPVVVDAADLMQSTSFREDVAVAIGLDPKAIVIDWTAATAEELASKSSMALKMTKSLANSTGINVSKALHGSSETFDKWKDEFGTEVAEILQERVKEEMIHWDYLYSHRFVTLK